MGAELASNSGENPAAHPKYGDERLQELMKLANSDDPLVADEAIQALREAQRQRKSAETAASNNVAANEKLVKAIEVAEAKLVDVQSVWNTVQVEVSARAAKRKAQARQEE